MAYCTSGEVQVLIQWLTFSTSSKITIANVTTLIDEADVEIDGRIGQIYTIPVTHATDVKYLAYASKRLAAYEVAKILVSQAGGEMPEIAESWKKDADKRITQIQKREIFLENTARRSIAKDGFYSHTAHDTDAPDQEWELDKEQW